MFCIIKNHILVVDEDKSIRDSVEQFLLSQGYRVKTTANSRNALKILDNEKVPIIFIALKMCGMNGLELCKQIKKRNFKCIIYAFSSYLKEYDHEQLESAGFDGYIKKPIRREIFKAAVEGALNKLRNIEQFNPALQSQPI